MGRNKKIDQFPKLNNPPQNTIFPAVYNGNNYSVDISALTTTSNFDVLGVRLSGFTVGDNHPITSANTILSAFQDIQVSKQDLLNIQLTGDPNSSSFINIDKDTANVNIVSVSTAQTEINISTETSGSTDSIILNEDGLVIESNLNGNTAAIILSDGFGITYTGTGIFNNNDGFYIKNGEKIFFPTSNISGDTFAKLSDLNNITTQKNQHWLSNLNKTIDSDEIVVISGNYVLSATNLTLNSDNLILNVSGITFTKCAQIFVGENLLLIDSNIVNNGIISVGGGVIFSGNSTITGTGILI